MINILGLDVGTNSVGWALVEHNFDKKTGKIKDCGVRIIPMAQDAISDFNKGALESSAAQRTKFRGIRRLNERFKLRRKRLIRTLKVLGMIHESFEVDHIESFAYSRQDGKTTFKFRNSHSEMLELFLKEHPKIKNIPQDWTIYYLRKKALTEKITTEELAWVILQFNQKRGYSQVRGESLESDSNKYFVNDYVDDIVEINESKARTKTFEIKLRSGIVAEYKSSEYPKWQGNKHDFIIIEKTLRDKSKKVTITQPNEEDWTLRKKKTESDIENSNLTVGEYIFNALLSDPTIKIRGKEVHTIDRKYYKEELNRILKKQSEFNAFLSHKNLLVKTAKILYKNNEIHRKELIKKSIIHCIVEDIIYYQRPLKSKKHLLSNCKYESYYYKTNEGIHTKPIKVIPKSHPLFQEYRIWSQIHNLKILEREYRDENGILKTDHDVTLDFISENYYEKVFELFDSKETITQSQFLNQFKLKTKTHRWNYEETIKLKGNETKAQIIKATKSLNENSATLMMLDNQDKLEIVWHALYSLTDNQEDIIAALSQPKVSLNNQTLGLTDEEITAISAIDPYKKEYGSLSKKAIAKLLPVMRAGKFWKLNNIEQKTLERINHILSAEDQTSISDRVRKLFTDFKIIQDFKALPEWAASYVVYNRHSESVKIDRFSKYEDIDVNTLLPQHSLRNPVVEKILRETLLIVKDIWKLHGRPDEIHIELARELKLPNDKRKQYTYKRIQNQATNDRAKAMLLELKKENPNINPFSIGQLEAFKLYEEGATNNQTLIEDDIKAIRTKGDPSLAEIQRYKLWLEQKYISPYTGQVIPLSKLFTPAYEIEHVIPKSRYYDNSFMNKIICEKEANSDKSDMTAYEYICKKGGTTLPNGTKILEKEEYEALVLKMYIGLRPKIKNLLSYDIPKSFISSQLNNTRYISKKLLSLLDPVVRDDKDTEERSRHILPMAGGITGQLKRDWGLSKVWKKLLAPRFLRMNEMSQTQDFYEFKNNQIHLSGNETELKRLDHRHHALDAIIVACTTRQHIQYINTYQNKTIRFDLKPRLFFKDKDGKYQGYLNPWNAFQGEVFDSLSNIIVSFKQNNRVINRTKNYYQKYVEKNGTKIKTYVKQDRNNDYWSIRKPLHKDTVYGKRTIREYKEMSINKVLNHIDSIADKKLKLILKQRLEACENDIKKLKKSLKVNPLMSDDGIIKRINIITYNNNYSSNRAKLDESFNKDKILKKVLGKKVKSDLLEHLASFENDPKLAFSQNGLIELNKKRAIPIKKITVIENLGKKISLNEYGLNSRKYVKSAKGTNLYFIIYRNIDTGELHVSSESSLSFSNAVTLMKEGLPLAEETEGYEYFILSPGDLVYVPDENSDIILPSKLDNSRIYKCVNFTGNQCFFIPHSVSISIKDKKEFSTLNKREKSIDDIMIKRHCIKLSVDRLGKLKNGK